MDDATARLWHAVKKSVPREATEALAQGADANGRDAAERTPLMIAAKRGDRPMLSLLLARGADVNAKDASGTTALVYALAPDHLAVVKLLLDAGADPTLRDKSGEDAIKQVSHKQTVLAVSTLASAILFVYGQRRRTKDRDLQAVELVLMGGRLYEAAISLNKYRQMKQLMRSTESDPTLDH